MAKIRVCPNCRDDYEETQTGCTVCSDTPTVLKPGNKLQAVLALGSISGTRFVASQSLGTDTYTVVRHLGWGAMAVAYLVTDKTGAKKVVKELQPNSKPNIQTKLLNLLLREADIQYTVGQFAASQVPAPKFVPFPKGYGFFESTYGVGSPSEIVRHYMVMDFMEGENWDEIQGEPPKGALPLHEVLVLGMELCIILRDFLHGYVSGGVNKPILHRDIKPANIQRLKSNSTSCLLDFGIARYEAVTAGTMARGTRAGSGAFAPPEHSVKGAIPTLAFDIYCMCSTLWTLLANEKEFPDDRQTQVAETITRISNPQIQQILLKGTEVKPSDRYQSAEELRHELERVYLTLRPNLPQHLTGQVRPVPVVAPAAPTPIPQPPPSVQRQNPGRLGQFQAPAVPARPTPPQQPQQMQQPAFAQAAPPPQPAPATVTMPLLLPTAAPAASVAPPQVTLPQVPWGKVFSWLLLLVAVCFFCFLVYKFSLFSRFAEMLAALPWATMGKVVLAVGGILFVAWLVNLITKSGLHKSAWFPRACYGLIGVLMLLAIVISMPTPNPADPAHPLRAENWKLWVAAVIWGMFALSVVSYFKQDRKKFWPKTRLKFMAAVVVMWAVFFFFG